MLSIPDVKRLEEEGVEVRLMRGRHPEGLKGWWLPDELEARIYLPSITSEKEIDITILHEFIHARNWLITTRHKDWERVVNKEAKDTYRKRPNVVYFIKCIYGLEKLL